MAAWTAGCGESGEAQRQREEAARREHAQQQQDRRKALLSALAAQHNADDSWGSEQMAWTLDVQERLAGSDKRPIAGIARLNDIQREGDKYIVYLDHGRIVGPVIRFVLTCPRPELPQAKRSMLLGESDYSFFGPEYAFVARIRGVSRRDLIESDEGKIETRRRWIVQGDCLALQPVPPKEAPSGPTPGARTAPRE